jgi:tetratricopeptide (TPR) repeat protein
MTEIASFTELEDLAEVGMQAFKELDSEQQAPELLAQICKLLGVMWAHRGQFRKSVGYLTQAHEIVTEQKPENIGEKSWANTNLGNCISSLNRYDEALGLHEKAEMFRIKDGHLSEPGAIDNQNIGRTLQFLGRLEEAKVRLNKALKQFASSENFAMIA